MISWGFMLLASLVCRQFYFINSGLVPKNRQQARIRSKTRLRGTVIIFTKIHFTHFEYTFVTDILGNDIRSSHEFKRIRDKCSLSYLFE